MNDTELDYIIKTQKIDFIFMFIGYIVNPLGIIFNSILIYLISCKTPQSLKSFSILLLNFGLCDFFSSLAGVLTLQKTVFSGWALTYIFHGVCGRLSPYFCYFLHVFVCHCFAHSQWILMVSFLYRYFILYKIFPKPTKIVRLSIFVYIPSFLFMCIYLIDAANPKELKFLVYKHHSKYKYHLSELWGEMIIAGNLSILSISTLCAIIYMTIPCFPIYIIIIVYRYKTLNILNSTGRILMSEKTRHSHKQLIKALTIQAIVPIFWLTAASFYLLLLFQFVHGPILENMLFRIMEFMPMITPLISMYFVRPYRIYIESWFYSKTTVKPLII